MYKTEEAVYKGSFYPYPFPGGFVNISNSIRPSWGFRGRI